MKGRFKFKSDKKIYELVVVEKEDRNGEMMGCEMETRDSFWRKVGEK